MKKTTLDIILKQNKKNSRNLNAQSESAKTKNEDENMSIEWDIEELAYRATGKTEAEAEKAINDGDIDEAIHEAYGTDCKRLIAVHSTN